MSPQDLTGNDWERLHDMAQPGEYLSNTFYFESAKDILLLGETIPRTADNKIKFDVESLCKSIADGLSVPFEEIPLKLRPRPFISSKQTVLRFRLEKGE